MGVSSPFCKYAGICVLERDFLYCGNPVLQLNIEIIIEEKTGKCKGDTISLHIPVFALMEYVPPRFTLLAFAGSPLFPGQFGGSLSLFEWFCYGYRAQVGVV